MRLLILLLLPTFVLAAPALKQPEKTDIELTLAADSPNELRITVRNHGKEPLVLPYRVAPFEQVMVTLQGATGKKYTIKQDEDEDAKARPSTVTIPAGQAKTFTMHTCHFLLEVGEPGEKVTFTARLAHQGKLTISKPLTVGHERDEP